MKKILAILCGVTMMFAACTPNEDGAGVVPTFPEEQNYEILSGKAQKLVFSAEYDWTLSVDYDFAYLKDSEGNNVDSCSGAAGENIEVFVAVESAIENYDNDIVFHVNMEMEGHTSVLATLTIKKLEYAVQEYEIESGASRRLQFRATEAWTVSMEDNDNAWLEYDSEKGYSFSGTATNELVTIWVKTEENIKNYDNDIVFSVNRKMGNADAQEWAKFTIKKLERPATIVLNETFESVTFEQNGHPSWGGEFSNAAEKYHLNYSSEHDLEGVSMSCNLENDYTIKVYAYNSSQSICENSYITEPWVSVTTFGTNGFKVLMDLTKESAEWSWWDTQYESYVNFEDAEGNVLVSIFCTSTYKPAPSTGGDTPAESVVKFSQDTSTFVSGGHPSWGGEFDYAQTKYALTFGDQWACADGVALKHSLEGVAAYKAYGYNASFSIQEVNDNYVTIDSDYEGGMFIVKMDTTAAMAKTSCNEGTGVYEGYVNLEDAVGNVLVSIYCTYNPNAQGGGETSGDVVSLVDASMASMVGVTLTKLEATAADYDATFGADYGVTDAPQYLLTYTQLAPFMMPQYAVLNITGFGTAQVMGQYTINGDTWYGYQVLSVWNNPDLGGVVIEPAGDYGFTAETIPNGKYPIAVYNGSYSPIARIVLDINVPM